MPNEDKLHLRFWGTRGSIPVSGPEFSRYGGNTSCIEIFAGDRHILFDAGSGLRGSAATLMSEGAHDFDLFFTHMHYDHIIGLPFFMPIYKPDHNIRLWSGHMAGTMTTQELVNEFMAPPFFPIKPDICPARLAFKDFKPGDILTPHPGIVLQTAALTHPGGCVGYRIEWAGKVIALVYDTEHAEGHIEEAAIFLMRDADLAVYDTTYTPEELPKKRGFGHSTWQEGVKLAKLAGTKRLAMFHHAAYRTDDELDKMQAEARQVFDGAFAAYDGCHIEF